MYITFLILLFWMVGCTLEYAFKWLLFNAIKPTRQWNGKVFKIGRQLEIENHVFSYWFEK